MLRLDYIKRFATVLMAAGVALVSCVEMAQPQSEAVGYLTAPMLDVDVTVQDMAQTKAIKPTVDGPSFSDIRFVVKDKDGNVKYDADGLWSEPLVLPVGAYSVEATYGSNGFDAAYFTGTATGTIDPLDSEVPALTVSLANSLVCVEIDAEFAQHFDVGSSKVALKSGSASAEVAYGEWTYVPSGADLLVTMTGTTAGEFVTLTHNLSSPSPKVAYNLVCKKSSTSWPSITWPSTQIADGAFEGSLYFAPATASNMSAVNAAALTYQVKGGSYSDWTDVEVSDVSGYKYVSGLSNGETYSLRACVGNIISEELSFTPVTFQSCFSMGSVTAAHNNNGNADIELSSTTMTVGNMKVNLPSIVAGMATVTASGSFSNSNNAATGSFSSVDLSSTAKNASFTNASGWPYLPQGAYSATVTATCTLNGATYTATATATPTVPAPVFKVVLSAYTSYDKYLEHTEASLTFANTESNKHTVFERKANVSIADALLSNTNYSKSSSITFNGAALGSFNQNSKDFGNDAGCTSWKSYPLTATMTFDGVNKSASKDCHITGLPYSKNFTSDTNVDNWDFVEKDYDKTYSRDYKAGCGYLLYYAYTNDYGCNLFSPTFYIPDNNVIVSYSATYYAGTTLHVDKSYTIYVGATTGTAVTQDKSTSITEKTYCSTSGFNSATISSTMSLSPNINRFCFSHNADLGKNQGSQHYLYFGSLSLTYSN